MRQAWKGKYKAILQRWRLLKIFCAIPLMAPTVTKTIKTAEYLTIIAARYR